MKTITMSIDDEILTRAERKAADLDTSVSDVVAEYLRQLADTPAVRQARATMRARFA